MSSAFQHSFDRWSVPNLASEEKEFAALNSDQQQALIKNIFESAREQGKQQGYQEGLSQGLQHSRTDTAAIMDALQTYQAQLEKPLQQIDQVVAKALVKLSVDLSEQIIRSEIKQRPELIAQQLEQALDTLSDLSIEVTARMNPLDVKAVSTLFLEDKPRYQQLNIIEDNNLERGDCCLDNSTSSVESIIRDKLDQMAGQLEVMLEHGISEERSHE